MLSSRWSEIADMLVHAFQPIVNPLTGITFAVEALVRNFKECGFASPAELFDAAHREGVLFLFDAQLRRKAIASFKRIPFFSKIKIFYNYDLRIHEMGDYSSGLSESILKEFGLDCCVLCYELSERYEVKSIGLFRDFLLKSKKRGFKIALDDFGAGFAGFELFYHSEPDFLKFDRFLIEGIESDVRKRALCTHIISLAKLLGIVVIAEGVETMKEFITCKELGCDLVQGYFIQPPVVDVEQITRVNATVREIEENNRRMPQSRAELIKREISPLDTLNVTDDFEILFKKFNRNSKNSFFPVLDANQFPVGIIHERSIKKYIYSPFGHDLLHNRSVATSLSMFVEKCPIVDINTSEDKILEIFVSNPNSEGVLITEDLRYTGFLTAKSLLNILNERNLMLAREMNPLTKLPGNMLIARYVAEALARGGVYSFIYFDFNNFKPFNDRFGFRQGDRAILLFAELLQKEFSGGGCFVGHIGGDDFFVGARTDHSRLDEICDRARRIMDQYKSDMHLFYEPLERERGFYRASDRDGIVRDIPLLSVSAAVLECNAEDVALEQDDILARLAELKLEAKRSDKGLAHERFASNSGYGGKGRAVLSSDA